MKFAVIICSISNREKTEFAKALSHNGIFAVAIFISQSIISITRPEDLVLLVTNKLSDRFQANEQKEKKQMYLKDGVEIHIAHAHLLIMKFEYYPNIIFIYK